MTLEQRLTALAQAIGADVHALMAAAAEMQSILDGKLSDAPVDGQTYGRKNGAWAVAPSGGGGSMAKRPYLWS
ncbi:MAG: hypothetical protein ACT4NV_02975 [Rhodoferax sp.]